MTLEPGLTPLDDDLNLVLDDLAFYVGMYGVVGIEGLEGLETDTDDGDGAGDGQSMGRQTIPSRQVTIHLNVVPDDASGPARDAAMDTALHDIGMVMNPLPDRDRGLRMLRYRLLGGVPKRLMYRAANGQAVSIAGDEARIKFAHADITLRVECPYGIILSDEYTDYELVAGVAQDVVNAGNFAALMPPAWELTGTGTVRLQNLTHPYDITFPSTGDLTVTRTVSGMAITGEDDDGPTYGMCHGPGNTPFPDPVVLYPGTNSIKASADCTLRVWSTWT